MYALIFAGFGIYLATMAVLFGGFGWLLLWPALSCIIVAAAYAGLGAGAFGKRPNGTLIWWAALPSLPYLAATWLVWHLTRLARREDCCHEVAPGLWVGRRPFARELPDAATLVVDLTAEFVEPRTVRTRDSYLCLPILDSHVPNEEAFLELVRKVARWQGGVYIHCASGHGRSATVAAAVLMVRGLAADAKAAENLMKRVRPGIRLSLGQRRLLGRVHERLRSGWLEVRQV